MNEKQQIITPPGEHEYESELLDCDDPRIWGNDEKAIDEALSIQTECREEMDDE